MLCSAKVDLPERLAVDGWRAGDSGLVSSAVGGVVGSKTGTVWVTDAVGGGC